MDGIYLKTIVRGSPGSYFARAKVVRLVQTVGCDPHFYVRDKFLILTGHHRVFKPKGEPYGHLDPKVCIHQSYIFGYQSETLVLGVNNQVAAPIHTQALVSALTRAHQPPWFKWIIPFFRRCFIPNPVRAVFPPFSGREGILIGL